MEDTTQHNADCIIEECGYFTCACCDAKVKWCYGAWDNLPHYCDDCWYDSSVK